MDKNIRKATLISILAPISWSTVPLAVYLLSHIPALLLTALCLLLFSLIEFARQLIKGTIYPISKLPLLFHLNGVLGIVGLHYFYFSAINMSPIAPVFLLINMGGVFIILYSKLFLGRGVTLKHYIGISLSVIGMLFISYGKNDAVKDFDNPYLGYLFAILAANCWAFYSVFSAKFKDIETNATVYLCFWSALICFAIYFITNDSYVVPSLNDYIIISYLGLFPVGYSFYFWNYGMRLGDVNLISILAYINPILAAILLIFCGLEEISYSLSIACILIISGSYIASRNS